MRIYPFTAPAVKLRSTCVLISKYKTMVGKVETNNPAPIGPQEVECCPAMDMIPTVNVLISSLLTNVMANINSFQADKYVKIDTVAMAGATSGIMMERNVR